MRNAFVNEKNSFIKRYLSLSICYSSKWYINWCRSL